MEFAIINQIDNGFDVLAQVRATIGKVATYDNFTAGAFKVGTIVRTLANWAYCAIVFTGFFCYYLGAQAGKSFYRVRVAAAEMAAEDLVWRDAVLDEACSPFREPVIALLASATMSSSDISIVDLGASTADLATLPTSALREMCESQGIKWRRAVKGRNLTTQEMIAALL